MTKMEKQTIYNALVEYAKTLDDKAEKSMAEGILTYWGDVVNAQSGTVTI